MCEEELPVKGGAFVPFLFEGREVEVDVVVVVVIRAIQVLWVISLEIKWFIVDLSISRTTRGV